MGGEGGSKWPLTFLQGGGGSQNFGKSAYVILERSLILIIIFKQLLYLTIINETNCSSYLGIVRIKLDLFENKNSLIGTRI